MEIKRVNYTSPTIFLKLFGVTPLQFERTLIPIRPLWQERVTGAYKRPGRNFKLPLEEMNLLTLLYYRSYVTQAYVGYLFGIDDSRVCRIMRRLEPMLAEVLALSKRDKLSKQEIESLILDATESPIERPQKGQKSYYSGKKKRHTLKTEIRVTLEGKIIHTSRPRPGSMHDFKLSKKSLPCQKERAPMWIQAIRGSIKSTRIQNSLSKREKTNLWMPKKKPIIGLCLVFGLRSKTSLPRSKLLRLSLKNTAIRESVMASNSRLSRAS